MTLILRTAGIKKQLLASYMIYMNVYYDNTVMRNSLLSSFGPNQRPRSVTAALMVVFLRLAWSIIDHATHIV